MVYTPEFSHITQFPLRSDSSTWFRKQNSPGTLWAFKRKPPQCMIYSESKTLRCRTLNTCQFDHSANKSVVQQSTLRFHEKWKHRTAYIMIKLQWYSLWQNRPNGEQNGATDSKADVRYQNYHTLPPPLTPGSCSLLDASSVQQKMCLSFVESASSHFIEVIRADLTSDLTMGWTYSSVKIY